MEKPGGRDQMESYSDSDASETPMPITRTTALTTAVVRRRPPSESFDVPEQSADGNGCNQPLPGNMDLDALADRGASIGERDARSTAQQNHPEYGPPVPVEQAMRGMRPRSGPGGFCFPPWKLDLGDMYADVNALFRCIVTSSCSVRKDSCALRRSLLSFYLMGRTNVRPTRECWEKLLQLTDGQSAPLRAVLRDFDERNCAEEKERFVGPPDVLESGFGEECEVSGDEYSDDEEDETEGDAAADPTTSDEEFIADECSSENVNESEDEDSEDQNSDSSTSSSGSDEGDGGKRNVLKNSQRRRTAAAKRSAQGTDDGADIRGKRRRGGERTTKS
ncbi:regulatory protein ICP22 [Spheniscid alphaherpesvirus 1]|uniref:Regulatory protein ICP22 n=1 Tax=Spheniscid alphaherpesvirus 1 TaxID=2560777 RepID=A0A1R3T8C7_9ALPH|nr:regulatory protein ICP22 [Spheniscid alphaherpesvirus 1]SCL76992.1 regulatory protein ICP22 [Spheniscid alphaherpesvirus 1]